MIQAFTELTKNFKSCIINPLLHFMENEASTAFKMTMTTMEIKYQLVPQVIIGQEMQRDPSRRSKAVS